MLYEVITQKLKWEQDALKAEEIRNAKGPGNVLTIEIESEALTEVFTGLVEVWMFARTGLRSRSRGTRREPDALSS